MFARSISRAAARSSALPSMTIRSYRPATSPMASLSAQKTAIASQQTRAASTEHAISNPTLASIEKRWEAMPPQEQAELWMQLRDRMKVNWHDLTLQEKKAAYWIAFGPHGPRAETPKGEGWRVFIKVSQLIAISFGIFYVVHLFARGQPKTMSKEWQEAANEYVKREKIEPITGPAAEGYVGKGHVQSPPSNQS
ncbi:Cytochrome c oxidase subunit 5B, mitochondrial [Paecilomyces lecythidis]|uniref:Cytochrome c oxidase subunit 5B, mitochondrial n=1 Tax=Paecilomyces lecythidis TaxID=3004212 RepID=A0ABR3WQ40_9EURO